MYFISTKCNYKFFFFVLGTVETHFEEFNFYKGIDAIIHTLHLTNKFFDSKKPWVLRNSHENNAHLNYVLHLTMESLRVGKSFVILIELVTNFY